MSRQVTIRSWQSMEDEFGLYSDGDIKMPKHFFSTCMRDLCGTTVELARDNIVSCKGECRYISEDMIEKESTIEEKSIEDFPLVETSQNGVCWGQSRYLFTNGKGWFICRDGPYSYMRPIKPVDIDDSKRRARLV